MIQLALRLVDPGLRLQVVGHGVDVDIRISAQLGELHLGQRLQRHHRLLVGGKLEARVVVVGAGDAT